MSASLQAPQAPARPSPRTRRQRMVAPTVVLGGLAVATLALRLRDPHESGSWGLCPSAMVGIWCPGCGGLRAVNDLTHLDLVGAASSNLALVVAMPVLVFLLGRWALESWTGRPRRARASYGATLLMLALGALAIFTVLRNVPAFTWLAP